MSQIIQAVAVTLTTFLLAVTVPLSCLTSCRVARPRDSDYIAQDKQQLRLIIPKAAWEPFFFKEIDARTKEANLPSLRTIVLPNDDLEVRVWFGAGDYGIDGIILQRTSGQWTGTYLYGLSKDPHFKKYQATIGPPRSGWEVAWQSLVGARLLQLPDASELKCNGLLQDGIGYVVETNTKKTYRTYMYDNPQVAKCDEAKQMIRIVEILDHEFDMQWPTAH
jgi:hypothetical protein